MNRYAIFILMFALTAVSCGREADRPASPTKPSLRAIVLISIDTCRADRLGCYGYALPTTPHIDALAKEAIRFDRVIAPVPLTMPSHATMLTGTNPLWHGVRGNLHFRLGASNVTLAETLKAAGYQTAGFVSSYVLDAQFSLNQGFDTYQGVLDLTKPSPDQTERIAADTTDRALKWLEKQGNEPFFLFVHFYDPHYPYEPPEPFASQFEHPYDGEIAYTDAQIGRIIDRLKKMGLYDPALLIVTSDHGEALGEHGEAYHGYFIYDATMRVPLIIKPPEHTEAVTVANETVGLVDIVPTILARANIEAPATLHGRDLLDRDQPATSIYCESLTPTTEGANPLVGVATPDWKFILTKRSELYALADDPGELSNLYDDEPDHARGMYDDLMRIIEQQSRDADDSSLQLDRASVERLEALGYVGGDVSTDVMTLEINPELPDPKDVIGRVEAIQQVNALIDQSKLVEAETAAKRVLADEPGAAQALISLARIAELRGRGDDAIAHYLQAIEMVGRQRQESGSLTLPGVYNSARYNLAVLYEKLKQPQKAIDLWRRLLGDSPDFLDAHYKLAHTLGSLGRVDESIAELREVLRLRPDHGQAHYNMGNAMMRKGRLSEAAQHFESAIRHGLDTAAVHNNLGIALGRTGRLEPALTHWRRAIELDPEGPEVVQLLNNIAMTQSAMGRVEQAKATFKQALSKAEASGRQRQADQIRANLSRLEE